MWHIFGGEEAKAFLFDAANQAIKKEKGYFSLFCTAATTAGIVKVKRRKHRRKETEQGISSISGADIKIVLLLFPANNS